MRGPPDAQCKRSAWGLARLRRRRLEVCFTAPLARTTASYFGDLCTSSPIVSHESESVQVFGRRDAEPIGALGRPASEKRQGTKSRWVRRWRCRGLYGELSGASGSKRMTRSGRADGFGPRRGCPCRAERADRGFVDRNDAGDAGRSAGPTQVEPAPVEIWREWRVSVRWWIGDDGIMRCRS
jgi:hypothetical protein